MTHRSDKSDNPMQRKNSLLHGLKTEVLLLGIILAIIFMVIIYTKSKKKWNLKRIVY